MLTVVALFAPASGMGCTMEMSQVTPEARTAIETRFPEAAVQRVEGKLGGLYEITLRQGEQVADVEVHRDGTILEVETLIDATELPKPVAETVSAESKGSELIKVEKVEKLARRSLGGIEKLDEPELYYEVKWLVAGFTRELEVSADGTIR